MGWDCRNSIWSERWIRLKTLIGVLGREKGRAKGVKAPLLSKNLVVCLWEGGGREYRGREVTAPPRPHNIPLTIGNAFSILREIIREWWRKGLGGGIKLKTLSEGR